MMNDDLKQLDPKVASIIQKELDRQRNTLELIASENFTPAAVLQATGSVLTNKYAEGLPGHRYYGGCQFVDEVETLAIERAKQLYSAEHANVQPHSGTQANMAAYFAVLQPGDKVMGMNLAHGGHLTHGSPVNFSGRFYEIVSYGVSKESETIDYDELRKVAKAERPKMLIAGASAYPRIIDFSAFASIAEEIGAYFMVDMAHIAGLIAAGLHPSPVDRADFVTSTTHKTLRGPRSGFVLCKAKHAKSLDKAVFPGSQGGPLMHEIAAKAVTFGQALQPEFVDYQRNIIDNARAMAAAFTERGFRVVSGGTDNHLMLIDLRDKDLSGKKGEELLGQAGIIVNKNAIPFDPEPPAVTSGIRLGTPAVTSRGMGAEEMVIIADTICNVLSGPDDSQELEKARVAVRGLCSDFPLYAQL